MGMYDDIIVPKSYLKGLLTKDQEKLIKDNSYQTKSLENFLGQYKIHSQKLYVKQGKLTNGKDGKWIKDPYDGNINFYTSFYDKNNNSWWVEFDFIFKDGTLDSKKIIKFDLQETAEEAEIREKDWKKESAKRKIFERTFRYKFFTALTEMLKTLLKWSKQKTDMNYISTPVEKKREKLSFWKHY
tara:strand:+ start:44 stop:598 length:555 start_codon:yes stop_codon:yes gene_type:complete